MQIVQRVAWEIGAACTLGGFTTYLAGPRCAVITSLCGAAVGNVSICQAEVTGPWHSGQGVSAQVLKLQGCHNTVHSVLSCVHCVTAKHPREAIPCILECALHRTKVFAK